MSGPSATVTRTNVLAGPGAMYVGSSTTTEPDDADVNLAPAVTGADPWDDVGATDGGLTVTVNQSFFNMTVDQVPDIVGRRLTERDVQASTSLAEPTLENLEYVLNDATLSSGTGFQKLEPGFGQAAMFPTERKLIVDGWAPEDSGQRRRRFLARRVVSIENVETAYQKDGKYMFPVTFGCMYVDASTPPCDWIDETS